MSTAVPPHQPATARSTRLAWVLVGAWLAGCLGALWSFELRASRLHETGLLSAADHRSLGEAVQRWQARRVAGGAGAAGPLVVRVMAPGCRCNAANDRHLARIQSEYSAQGVRVESVAAADLRREPGLRALGATPVALVFNAGGSLAYLGPFSDDAVCGAGAGFVERTLGQLARGEHPRASPVLARGCSCGTDAVNPESLT